MPLPVSSICLNPSHSIEMPVAKVRWRCWAQGFSRLTDRSIEPTSPPCAQAMSRSLTTRVEAATKSKTAKLKAPAPPAKPRPAPAGARPAAQKSNNLTVLVK